MYFVTWMRRLQSTFFSIVTLWIGYGKKVMRWFWILILSLHVIYLSTWQVGGRGEVCKLRKGLLLIWHTSLWIIWRARNDFIFNNRVEGRWNCGWDKCDNLALESKRVSYEMRWATIFVFWCVWVFGVWMFWLMFGCSTETSSFGFPTTCVFVATILSLLLLFGGLNIVIIVVLFV